MILKRASDIELEAPPGLEPGVEVLQLHRCSGAIVPKLFPSSLSLHVSAARPAARAEVQNSTPNCPRECDRE